jgi:mannose-1-phosphate guanylyltransferase/mannose-6-phosphate isomerase
MTTIYPVIMCGGAGTRLWPLSTKIKPKQFHSLITKNSMLQETVIRAEKSGNLSVADPIFVCSSLHETTIKSQCKTIGVNPLSIILEPCARNTAAVAAVVSLEVERIDSQGLVLLLPADHHIEKPGMFWEAIERGIEMATSGYITTFGIQPTHPETGYGYIQGGKVLHESCVKVEAFVEKPDKPTAELYVNSKNYFWNAGIFLFSPSVMIEAFNSYAIDIIENVKDTISISKRSASSLYLDFYSFSHCRSISVDYAIMENSENIAMVCPVDIGWIDFGSWDAISDYMVDPSGNIPVTGNAITIDCDNTLVNTTGIFIAAIGLKNTIVIATENSILICDNKKTQNVKDIVQKLENDNKLELL